MPDLLVTATGDAAAVGVPPCLLPQPASPRKDRDRENEPCDQVFCIHLIHCFAPTAAGAGIQNGSLLLAPSVVNCTTCPACALLFRSITPGVADTAKMFQFAA